MKKATLGRGLDALIPKDNNQQGLTLAGINEIKPNFLQPRKEFDDESITELSASIKEKGILQPLVVRQTVNGYEIIAGERRWRAAQRAGITRVPVIIKDVTDGEALELALIENLQREDLNPLEEANAYEHLIEEFGLTHEEVSSRIGKDRSTITNQLRLLKLSEEAKSALINGEITAGHARAILSVESSSEASLVLAAIRKRQLSVRKTESLVQSMSGKQKVEAASGIEYPYIRQLSEDIKRALSTQVRIKYSNGKGKIEIEYYSEEELERISGYLLGNKE